MTATRKQDSRGRNLCQKLDDKLSSCFAFTGVSGKLMIPALLPEKGVERLEVTLRNNSHVKSGCKQARLHVCFGMVVGE